MKSYLGIVPISARVHRRQSRMTRICIILAVFLVTALFSMADMWIKAEKEAMIRKHGDYHIKLLDVQEDKAREIGERPDVASFERSGAGDEEDEEEGYYIRFEDETNLRKSIADIKDEYGLTDENIEENKAILALLGASSSETAKNIYPIAVIAFVLILVSGVLMISGCINSNVAQRTKFFGMLRCIGASRQQIMRIVRMEALNWCKTSIPEGCILGVASCWVACAVLRFLVRGEFVDMPLFGVSVVGIVSGILVGIITVFIAAHAPAKQAARVSPISAVSGNAGPLANVRHAASTRIFKVETTLGIQHAVSAKKNLFLLTGSFALSIALLLICSACLDIIRNLIPETSNFAPDVALSSPDNTNSIDQDLLKEISAVPGVECAFGTQIAPAFPVEINGNKGYADLISYDEFMMESSKDYIASGELSAVYGDSDYVLSVFQESSRLDVGDKIKIGSHEVEIACILSFGIGGVSGDIPSVVCSEETFTRLTGEQDYCMVNVIFSKDASEATVDQIQKLAGDNLFADRREEDKEVVGSYWVFRVGIYGFLAIIAFITVLNIMNNISMSVSARIRQYGAMRAVGMESRQVTKMITAEAITYAVCGSIAGLIFGLLLHNMIYTKLLITHFGGTWKLPVTTIAVILLLVFASCVLAVYAPSKRMRNLEITETINEL